MTVEAETAHPNIVRAGQDFQRFLEQACDYEAEEVILNVCVVVRNRIPRKWRPTYDTGWVDPHLTR